MWVSAETKRRRLAASALLECHPARVRGKLWQAGLVHAGIMGEHGVLPRGAGGAARVGVVGGVLVQRHREIQILLRKTQQVWFTQSSRRTSVVL